MAYSKSFLSVMALMIRCILYPGAHLFVTSGGKEQGASILHDKVQEICELIPSLKKEIDWTPEEDGVYKIWVDVKDEDGNKEYKCISINIKK